MKNLLMFKHNRCDSEKKYRLSKNILNYYYLAYQYNYSVFAKKVSDENKTYLLVNPNRKNTFYIVSQSAKEPGKLQATYFFNNEPYSDIIRDSFTEIMKEVFSVGFTIIKEARS